MTPISYPAFYTVSQVKRDKQHPINICLFESSFSKHVTNLCIFYTKLAQYVIHIESSM